MPGDACGKLSTDEPAVSIAEMPAVAAVRYTLVLLRPCVTHRTPGGEMMRDVVS